MRLSSAGESLMTESWSELLKLLMGSSSLGKALRTVIVYVILLAIAYIVGLVNPVAGAWFTIILLLGNVAYLYKISEASWRFVKQQILPVSVTLVMAVL